MAELQRLLPPHILRIYYPADFPGAVRRAMKAIQPRAMILVEAELWPNFLCEAIAARCPLFLVNARISDRSLGITEFFGVFLPAHFCPIFAAVGCQQPEDARRMIELGFRAGSRARDRESEIRRRPTRPARRVGCSGACCGRSASAKKRCSSWRAAPMPGEEAMLAEMLIRLRRRFPDLFLVLVPRHFERTKEVVRELETRGVKYICRSDIPAGDPIAPGRLECLLVNSTGELKFFYEQATVVFVGKSIDRARRAESD